MIKIEYIEIEVPNLHAAIHYYSHAFQLRMMATHTSDEKFAVLLQQGSVKIIISESQKKKSLHHSNAERFESDHVVKEIGYLTADVKNIFDRAISMGQEAVSQPSIYPTKDGDVCTATVLSIGNIRQTFLQRFNQSSSALPHFEAVERVETDANELSEIDHIAICVQEEDLDKWVNLYVSVYDFQQSYEEYVSTEKSGMNSKVVESKNGKAKIVFVAPIKGKMQSQITDYLRYNGGPCIQHIAFATNDILHAVNNLRQRGVEFLTIPDQYYEIQKNKIGLDFETQQILKSLSILVDKQESGLLYQIFTKSHQSRPTLFFEIIQRSGCDGFGSGNIKALFQAIEQEQMKRDALH